MESTLSNLKPPRGSRHRKVRVGRGMGSKMGKTLNAFAAGDTVTPESLADHGIVRAMRDGVKVLGNGELKVALTVRAHAFSKSAEQKITQAGGKVEVI